MDRFMKMIYNKSLKIIVNTLGLVGTIIKTIVQYHSLQYLILIDVTPFLSHNFDSSFVTSLKSSKNLQWLFIFKPIAGLKGIKVL